MVVPYRIATTPEPAPLDEVDVYEAQLRAASNRLRLVVLTTFAAVAATSIVTLVEAHSRLKTRHHREFERSVLVQNAREVIGAATSFAVLERARFDAAMKDALASEDGELPVCNLGEKTTTAPLALFTAADRELSSPSLARIVADANLAEAQLATDRFADGIATANALSIRIASSATWPKYDVVLVTTKLKPPSVETATAFSPGEVSGRAYVYDFDKHRVICAGDVEATNSDRVEYTFAPSVGPKMLAGSPRLLSTLGEDLERQIRDELAEPAILSHKVERREPGAGTEIR